MLEWRRLAANRKVRRMAASIPNTAPVVHFTPSRSRYQFILLGEQRHTCVNNLPRVALSGGTAGNRTCNISITNPTPYRYAATLDGEDGGLSKPRPRVQRATGPQLLRDGHQPARLEPMSSLTTILSRHSSHTRCVVVYVCCVLIQRRMKTCC